MTSSPPLAAGLPILGSALSMSNDLVGFLVKQYLRYGPIFRVRALNREMVVLAGAEANVFVTREGADKFSSFEIWAPFASEFGVEDYVQSVDGDVHTRYRKILKRGYAASMMLSRPELLVGIAQKVLDGFEIDETTPALYLLRLIVTGQLGMLLANHTVGDDLQDLITTTGIALNVYLVEKMPKLMLRHPNYQRARQRFLKLGSDILDEHYRANRAEPDLIDDLIAASEDAQNADILGKREQLVMAALGPFIAGLDTVANECTFMLYALFQHPDLMRCCVEEADRLFEDGVPTAAKLRSLDVLHATMMETLRRYPIAPAVTRVAAKDFEFAGYQIKRGEKVLLASTVAHFLPELYANPDQFDITRYSEPRSEHKQRGAYAPFGIGPHTCLGAGAAEIQMALVMASLLHMVRVEQIDPQAKLPIKSNPTLTLGYNLRVKIVERRHHVPIEVLSSETA